MRSVGDITSPFSVWIGLGPRSGAGAGGAADGFSAAGPGATGAGTVWPVLPFWTTSAFTRREQSTHLSTSRPRLSTCSSLSVFLDMTTMSIALLVEARSMSFFMNLKTFSNPLVIMR
jgi:hypothetical protein